LMSSAQRIVNLRCATVRLVPLAACRLVTVTMIRPLRAWMLRPTRLSARIRTSRHFGDEALGGAAHERAPAGPPLGS
jgi:hypothetical protein